MAKSNIEWTGKVWNPTTGCNKVSRGCKNCYAEKMHKRLMHMKPEKYNRPFLDGAFEYEPALEAPFKWKKRDMVFVDSMSDLFHENISMDYIAKCYAVMFLNPQLTFQVLTKRPERRLDIFNNPEFIDLLWRYANQFHDIYIRPLEQELYQHIEIAEELPFKNIWEMTSVENQATANERIPILLQTPAHIRGLSMEPMVGPVNLLATNHICGKFGFNVADIDWIIVGGESGPKRDPFNMDWFRDIRDFCNLHGIRFFMKQTDKVIPIPEDLQIREFPLNLSHGKENINTLS